MQQNHKNVANKKPLRRSEKEWRAPLWTAFIYPSVFVPSVFITQLFYHGRTPIEFIVILSIGLGAFFFAVLTIVKLIRRKHKQNRAPQ